MFRDVVRVANSCEKISHIGINCTAPQYVEQLLQSAQLSTNKNQKPYVIYPNSGEIYNAKTKEFVLLI